ncbi:MAG TPA: heavy metal-associated domain-containing protein [Anaerolineae bacterium]|nr:heavy metal-associated domain-containing protein [Anaerolineae bacterium]
MNTQQVSFAIRGMTCARCAVQIERALTQLEGVIAAQVNYASERATVRYTSSRISPAMLVRAVIHEGFQAQLEGELVMKESLRFANRFVPSEWRRWILPPVVGFLGALALTGLYVGILSVAQSPSHALEQLSQDRLWVGLVALGFGIQIGLYAYLRLIVSAMQLAGATAMTGAGTTTSTVGIIACCAHHLADIAPLIGLTGVSGVSGAVAFLAEWKIPFILFGLAVNAVAIVMSIRRIRRERAHLKMMETAVAPSTVQAAACH